MSKDELNMELKIAELKIQNQSYQEYIKYLEDRADYYEDKTLELQKRIDKAIEYIEHLDNVFIDSKEQDNIVNILKGDNK